MAVPAAWQATYLPTWQAHKKLSIFPNYPQCFSFLRNWSVGLWSIRYRLLLLCQRTWVWSITIITYLIINVTDYDWLSTGFELDSRVRPKVKFFYKKFLIKTGSMEVLAEFPARTSEMLSRWRYRSWTSIIYQTDYYGTDYIYIFNLNI